MRIRSMLAMPAARLISQAIGRWSARAVADQHKWRQKLVQNAANTAFGKAHGFDRIRTPEQFSQSVPIRDYEALRPWIDRIVGGEANVMWPGRPRYFAKTSGTTSGVKYIPLTRDSVPSHFGTARDALFHYIAQKGSARFMDGKMIFLSGSPEMSDVGGIPTGRLSGISNHLVPGWLRTNQLPSWQTNCIEDWEQKLDRIVEETLHQDMRLISGIPPWVQMYYERLLERTGKSTVKEIFPNFSVFVYGGVNYEPYRASLEALVGARIDSVETYPASEGFVAFQDCFPHEGLLLNTDAGMYFEFVPASEWHTPSPPRLALDQVETGVNYAIVINSNAGLWGYNLGDTVEFVSLNPYRLRVTGRIKHFISAFGEHVIGKEVEEAILPVAAEQGVQIVEFTVAPRIEPPTPGGLPCHEWFVEFATQPSDLAAFAAEVDRRMCLQNIYYNDLITGNILQPLIIRPLRRDAFRDYMRTQGKLGGQNKVPRLSNDRTIADFLSAYIVTSD